MTWTPLRASELLAFSAEQLRDEIKRTEHHLNLIHTQLRSRTEQQNNLYITGYKSQMILTAIKSIRYLCGTGLLETKNLVQRASPEQPILIKRNIEDKHADDIQWVLSVCTYEWK